MAHATVTIVAHAPGGPRERLRVGGLGLQATLARDGGGFRVAASLGTAAAPLALTIDRARDGAPAGTAELRLWAELSASPTAAAARLDVEVRRQTLSPSTPVHQAAHLEASARVDAGRIAVTLSQTRLADGAATVDASVELPDAAPLRVEHAEGAIDLPHLLTLVPASLVPIEAERARLRYRVRHLVLAAVPRLED